MLATGFCEHGGENVGFRKRRVFLKNLSSLSDAEDDVHPME
jgi:hypothetical protein